MYRLSEFDGVDLPKRMGSDDLSTGAVTGTLTPALGQVFDLAGADRRLPRVQQIQVSGLYSAQDGDLRTQVTLLKALIGVRGQLWRRRDADGVRQWKTARLLSVSHEREAADVDVAELDASFETPMVGWRAETLKSVAQTGTNFGFTVANNGTMPVDDAVVEIKSGGALSSVRITMSGGVDFLYSNSLPINSRILIDCGALTVRAANGDDRYQYFSLGAGHTVGGWLPLAVGANSLSVAANANVTVTVKFYEQYA